MGVVAVVLIMDLLFVVTVQKAGWDLRVMMCVFMVYNIQWIVETASAILAGPGTDVILCAWVMASASTTSASAIP